MGQSCDWRRQYLWLHLWISRSTKDPTIPWKDSVPSPLRSGFYIPQHHTACHLSLHQGA